MRALVLDRDRLALAHVGAAGGLRHPLSARPEACGIARGEARDRAIDQRLVARSEQRARGAVGHRERARVDVARGAEQIRERELVQSRVRAERGLVRRGDHAVLGHELRAALPERRHDDLVDALAPRRPLHELRIAQAILGLHAQELGRRELAHLAQARRDARAHVARRRTREEAPERSVRVVLVREGRGRLVERPEVHVRDDATSPARRRGRGSGDGRAAGWGASLRKRTRRPELRYGPTPRPSRREASRGTGPGRGVGRFAPQADAAS
jgi:hypothetical protein